MERVIRVKNRFTTTTTTIVQMPWNDLLVIDETKLPHETKKRKWLSKLACLFVNINTTIHQTDTLLKMHAARKKFEETNRKGQVILEFICETTVYEIFKLISLPNTFVRFKHEFIFYSPVGCYHQIRFVKTSEKEREGERERETETETEREREGGGRVKLRL